MFKKNDVNIAEKLTDTINNINFEVPDIRMEQIDAKLEVLLNNMEYKNYLSFIKSDKKLKIYDDILGKYANGEPLSKIQIKYISQDMYDYINKLIDNKIKELNLQ